MVSSCFFGADRLWVWLWEGICDWDCDWDWDWDWDLGCESEGCCVPFALAEEEDGKMGCPVELEISNKSDPSWRDVVPSDHRRTRALLCFFCLVSRQPPAFPYTLPCYDRS